MREIHEVDIDIIHKLKIEPNYLKRLMDGSKKFEIRYNDRDYQLYDILEFFNNERARTVYFKITHVFTGIGLMDNYVILSVEQVYVILSGGGGVNCLKGLHR